ncbi:DUF58 domain-containing protein [Halovivax cerinus]|uniref:DUF58 domain-containing protein n=1 Tax=Halovivax cerinus TaxID=1487865 RepID=A0ABD5NQK5_9EURY|nr:DUF58 domain-containing protein [Halovivax cerinus]
MHFVRQSRAVGALAAFAVAFGVALGRPVGLAGAALIGAWLVGRQFAFVATLSRTTERLTVGQVPERTGVRTNETEYVHLEAVADDAGVPDGSDLSIGAGLPTATRAAEPLAIDLDAETDRASASTAVTWPVAGRHRFDPVTIDVSDGWFRETLSADDRPTVTVEPDGPRAVHVGEGGERFALGAGEHGTGAAGSGLEPAEVREYTAGDDVRRIDWKATARLDAPHVREFESETDRRTAIVVDARRSLAVGPRGETPLAHIADVGLAIAASARRLGDPVGLVTVGDGGVRTRIPVSAATEAGVQVRRALLEVETIEARAPSADPTRTEEATEPPAAGEGASTIRGGRGATEPDGGTGGVSPTAAAAAGSTPHARGATGTAGEPSPDAPERRSTTAADARAAGASLGGDDAFSRTLAPFYADRGAYVERVASEPLFAAVDELLARESGTPWTVVLTDDAARAELRETVAAARSRGSEVLVAIAPRVLYEPGGLADADRAYERYADFDAFRRRLARQPGVRALEVGPADRLATVLEAGRTRERGGTRDRGGTREDTGRTTDRGESRDRTGRTTNQDEPRARGGDTPEDGDRR